MRFIYNDEVICDFDQDDFPSFCGGVILHDFAFERTGHITSDISEAFQQCCLAASVEKFPKNARFTEGGSPQRLMRASHILFADAKYGERGDPKRASLWDLCSHMPDVYAGEESTNPNSGRTVRVFELVKHYTEEEIEEDDD